MVSDVRTPRCKEDDGEGSDTVPFLSSLSAPRERPQRLFCNDYDGWRRADAERNVSARGEKAAEEGNAKIGRKYTLELSAEETTSPRSTRIVFHPSYSWLTHSARIFYFRSSLALPLARTAHKSPSPTFFHEALMSTNIILSHRQLDPLSYHLFFSLASARSSLLVFLIRLNLPEPPKNICARRAGTASARDIFSSAERLND